MALCLTITSCMHCITTQHILALFHYFIISTLFKEKSYTRRTFAFTNLFGLNVTTNYELLVGLSLMEDIMRECKTCRFDKTNQFLSSWFAF